MSQNTREHSNSKHASKHAPVSERNEQEPPITGFSPNEPFPIPSDGTGKPGDEEQ